MDINFITKAPQQPLISNESVTVKLSKINNNHNISTDNHLPKNLTTKAIKSLDQPGDDNLTGSHHSCASETNEHHNDDDVQNLKPHNNGALDSEFSNHPSYNLSTPIIVNNNTQLLQNLQMSVIVLVRNLMVMDQVVQNLRQKQVRIPPLPCLH